MGITGDIVSIYEDERFLEDAVAYKNNDWKFNELRRQMTYFVNEAISCCNNMLDDNANDYIFYSEAVDFKKFFSDLWEKIKSIVKKIYDWLKDAIQIIGKFIFAPFGVIFKKDNKSKDTGGGGGGSASSGSGSKDKSSSTPSTGDTGSGSGTASSASIPGLLEAFGPDMVDMKYIKNNGGYSNVCDIPGFYREIISLAEGCNLISNINGNSDLLADLKDKESAYLSSAYTKLLKDIDTYATTFNKKLLAVNNSNRGNMKESVIASNIKTIMERANAGAGTATSMGDLLGVNLKDQGTQRFMSILKSIGSSKADICVKSVFTNDNANEALDMLNRKRAIILAVLGTKGSSVEANVKGMVDSLVVAYTPTSGTTPSEESKAILAELQSLKTTMATGAKDMSSVKGYVERVIAILKKDNQGTYTTTPGVGKSKKPTTTTKGFDKGVNRSDTLGTLETKDNLKIFKIEESDLYGVVNYAVDIKTVDLGTYIKALVEDEGSIDEGIANIESMLATLKTTATSITKFTTEIGKVKDDTGLAIDTAGETGASTVTTKPTGTATTEAGAPPATATDDPAVVQQYRGMVVELVKDALKSLKDDISVFMNQMQDVEKHNRVGCLSVIQLSYLKDIVKLQSALLYENMMYTRLKQIETKHGKDIEDNKGKKDTDVIKADKENIKAIDNKEGTGGLRKKIYDKLAGR